MHQKGEKTNRIFTSPLTEEQKSSTEKLDSLISLCTDKQNKKGIGNLHITAKTSTWTYAEYIVESRRHRQSQEERRDQ